LSPERFLPYLLLGVGDPSIANGQVIRSTYPANGQPLF